MDSDRGVVYSLARPFPGSYWVVPGRLLAGEYPGSELVSEAVARLRGLLALEIDTFIDLTIHDAPHPYEPLLRMEAARLGRRYGYYNLGIRDFSTPSPREMKRILDTIDTALANDHNVYIHCLGGIGRTGTVVGCFLARHGQSGPAALNEINRLRQGVPGGQTSPETDRQRSMVLQWSESH